MKRRDFITKLASAAGWGLLGNVAPGALFAQTNFAGKLLVNLQLEGALDVTSYCDPKMNQPGEREINTWARSSDTQTAGNINYAPFATNSTLFEKYYQDMLVINGVDAQTNSHTVGVVHNWSGRNSDGYPSLTSLYAASNAPNLPLAYLNFGGFGNTDDIIRSSRISDIGQIGKILFPNTDVVNPNQYFHSNTDFQRIKALQLQTAQQLAAQTGIPAGQRKHRRFFVEALSQADGLSSFAASQPSANQLQQPRELSLNLYSNLHQQMQISLLAMRSGVSVAADLYQGGYDTHQNHDQDHTILLDNLNDALDYFWTYAEELGLADRIVLVIGSDFGRTPHYNSGSGKDHWPIGSYIVMERNASFTNRAFGETDGGHNTYPVNLQTGLQDYVNGARIYPKHVHLALRKYLGIHNNQLTSSYPFK